MFRQLRLHDVRAIQTIHTIDSDDSSLTPNRAKQMQMMIVIVIQRYFDQIQELRYILVLHIPALRVEIKPDELKAGEFHH